MAAIAPKSGFSVATSLLKAGCGCVSVFKYIEQVRTRLDYSFFRPISCGHAINPSITLLMLLSINSFPYENV